jgi:UDP-N-acetylmuramate dehydrogenase
MVKLSAAQLIDRAGWKGVRRATVAVWSRQPLVLVNLGGAGGADVLALAQEIRADLLGRFGIGLELEPRVVGCDYSDL